MVQIIFKVFFFLALVIKFKLLDYDYDLDRIMAIEMATKFWSPFFNGPKKIMIFSGNDN
jgi:hypothetical protein